MPKILILATLALILAACGPNSQNTRQAGSRSAASAQVNGRIVVTPGNLKRLFPDWPRRKRFIAASLGPYSFVYRECVYYKATQFDQGGDIVELIERAQGKCDRYLFLVRRWIDTISRKSRIYYLSPAYRRVLVQAVRLASFRNASKLLRNKRRGIPVRSPRNPDELLEKLKRRLTGERAA